MRHIGLIIAIASILSTPAAQMGAPPPAEPGNTDPHLMRRARGTAFERPKTSGTKSKRAWKRRRRGGGR